MMVAWLFAFLLLVLPVQARAALLYLDADQVLLSEAGLVVLRPSAWNSPAVTGVIRPVGFEWQLAPSPSDPADPEASTYAPGSIPAALVAEFPTAGTGPAPLDSALLDLLAFLGDSGSGVGAISLARGATGTELEAEVGLLTAVYAASADGSFQLSFTIQPSGVSPIDFARFDASSDRWLVRTATADELSQVPAPSTVALLSTGLMVLVARRSSRRRQETPGLALPLSARTTS